MNGRVDEFGRARVEISVMAVDGRTVVFEAWIDTGFTGTLILTKGDLDGLALTPGSEKRGSVADGRTVFFPTYRAVVEWCGQQREIDILEGSSRLPLVGVELLEDLLLTIDYPARTVRLELSPSA